MSDEIMDECEQQNAMNVIGCLMLRLGAEDVVIPASEISALYRKFDGFAISFQATENEVHVHISAPDETGAPQGVTIN